MTFAAASATGLAPFHQGFDLPVEGFLHTDCPHYYRFHEPGESEEDFTSRLADNLERLILAENPDTVAAFIAEPIMGAGGVLVLPDSYFPKIQQVLKKYAVHARKRFGTLAFILASETVLNRSGTLSRTVPSENGSGENGCVHTAT